MREAQIKAGLFICCIDNFQKLTDKKFPDLQMRYQPDLAPGRTTDVSPAGHHTCLAQATQPENGWLWNVKFQMCLRISKS